MSLTNHALAARTKAKACLGSFAVLFMVALLWNVQGAHAQSDSDWESGPSEAQCVPKCRSGYACSAGECVPICSPPCGAGFLCTQGGACVRTQAPPPPVAQPPLPTYAPAANQCLPSCRRGFTCVSGQCVSACNPPCFEGEACNAHGECVPQGEAGAEGDEDFEEGGEPRDASADSIINVHFDALGLLQFGITPTLEVGKRISGYARLRLINTGLASYFLLGRRDSDDELHWGLGGALGMHIFSSREGSMRGVMGGVALEYAFIRTRDDKVDKIALGTHALIPELDLGYRWAFDSFLLGLGGRVGFSIPVGQYDEPIEGGTCTPELCDEERQLRFLAGAFLDLGWYL